MKTNWKLVVIAILTAVLLIPFFAFSQRPLQNKTRHIRMMKIENGKKMEIDTLFTGDNLFVWNGDTINPEKHIKRFRPSEFDKIHGPGMERRQKDMRFFRYRGGLNGEPFIMHGDSGEALQLIPHEGDSLGQRIFIQRRFNNGDKKDHFIDRHSPDDRLMPHAPWAPAAPRIKMFRGNQSGKGINLNDPNIISFKKKNISGGREKIEIIRKKTKRTKNMDFGEGFQVPEPPIPPRMEGEYSAPGTMDNEIIINKADKKTKRKAARENK